MVVHNWLKECRLYQISCSVFPAIKLRGLNPNSYIHVQCVRFIYSQDRSAYLAAEIAHRYMNVETGRQNIIILFWK
jgi:hypothetical protein